MRIRQGHRSPALLVCLLLVSAACGGSSDDDGSGEDVPLTDATRTGAPPDLSNAGTIVVSATFSGEVPEGAIIDMGSDPSCARRSGRRSRPVSINEDGTLRSVLVYVRTGLEGMAFPDPGPPEPVFGFDLEGQLTQSGCLFRPRILATRTDQAITLRNGDEVHHRATAEPLNNPGFSADQAMTGMEMQHSFPNAEVGIAVRCEVHPWMSAVIHVFDHPYFTVLGEDNRRFEFDPLPPGEYVLEARHDTLGTKTLEVTVAPSGTTEVAFAFGT